MTTSLSLAVKLGNDGDGAMLAELRNLDAKLADDFSLCFSLIAPGESLAGCKTKYAHGGFLELVPVDATPLEPNSSWEFSFRYCESRHQPLNVSWGPQLPYVISGDEILPVTVTLDFGPAQPPLPRPAPVELELALVPTPVSFQASEGLCKLNNGLAISDDLADDVATCVHNIASLGQRVNLPTALTTSGNGVELAIELNDDLPATSYQLAIEPAKVSITAASVSSLSNALVSVLQLGALYPAGIPCGVIQDEPRFAWRGMHFDCARHYYAPETICKFLDLLALLKFNRLHWHLIDDEAFRLELNSYPQLAEQTAMRGHGCLIPGVFGAGAGPCGGSYSKADVQQVVEHARKLGIEVMPEIEIPCHAWALLQVLPQLRDPADQSDEISVQGYLRNSINPAVPATWEFLGKVIPEIAELFPFKVMHLGCDEIPPKLWTKSPAIAQWQSEHNLADKDSIIGKMVYETAEIVAACGVRPAAWEEASRGSNGGIGHDALLFSWSGQGPGLAAARNGYQVVMTPAQHTYLDMAPSTDPMQRGMNWAAILPLADTVAWEPVPLDEPELAKQIVGVQGALWSETVKQDGDHEIMIAPRILGVAESAWAERTRRANASRIHALADAWEQIFALMNWQSNPTR